ncbi:MAG TPA: single-stranded DNA-binding protein [Dietzia timorensis]|uniref:Single-stranded DNA-binding protein n=1 Tax=Dietzia timorensis TaxID=499555 RepID=A0A921F1P5_9ACTN|nr:R3H domain-containing nucleic acid-binding protein [Dietzia timorensis]HJE90176.1 single-stranded DNA-binding protein [Dietzia timorensis]
MSADEKQESDDILVEEGEVAGDYLEGLLDILDYDGDIDLDVEGDRATVTVDGSDDLKNLVGGDGKVLEALQELTRLTVQQELGSRSRLMLDISGWRATRKVELASMARDVAESVKVSQESADLSPMSPFERKVVHDAIAEFDGVRSDSSGQEPDRFVVIHPV